MLLEGLPIDVSIAKRFVSKYHNALNAGHEFDLTYAQFKKLCTRKFCALSGIKFKEYRKGATKGKPDTSVDAWTLDRVDSSKGYTIDNVLPVCYVVNQFKGQLENPASTINFEIATKIIKEVQKHLDKS